MKFYLPPFLFLFASLLSLTVLHYFSHCTLSFCCSIFLFSLSLSSARFPATFILVYSHLHVFTACFCFLSISSPSYNNSTYFSAGTTSITMSLWVGPLTFTQSSHTSSMLSDWNPLVLLTRVWLFSWHNHLSVFHPSDHIPICRERIDAQSLWHLEWNTLDFGTQSKW